MLHAPQLLSVFKLVSQPLLNIPSQLPKPGKHSTNAHVPVAHEALPLVNAHLTSQPPQSVNVFSGTSHPLFASLSQSARPLGQFVTTHSPSVHRYMLPLLPPTSQARPQAPQ